MTAVLVALVLYVVLVGVVLAAFHLAVTFFRAATQVTPPPGACRTGAFLADSESTFELFGGVSFGPAE